MSTPSAPLDPQTRVKMLRLRSREHRDAAEAALNRGDLVEHQERRSLASLEREAADAEERRREK